MASRRSKEMKEIKQKPRCKQSVASPGRFGSFHPHQCSRYVWKDGYCKQHHPDTKEARLKANEDTWKRKQRMSPAHRLVRTNKCLTHFRDSLKVKGPGRFNLARLIDRDMVVSHLTKILEDRYEMEE